MRLAVAKWLQAVLSVRRSDETTGPVASDLGVRAKEADGRDVVLVSQGDALDFIYGSERTGYTVVQLSVGTVLRLAWFVLWRWWIRGTWFGWKLAAWQWALAVQIDEEVLRKSAELRKREYASRQAKYRGIR